jgi:hypothetical protein
MEAPVNIISLSVILIQLSFVGKYIIYLANGRKGLPSTKVVKPRNMNAIYVALFLALGQAPELPKVVVTQKVSVQSCRLLKLTAETNGKQLKWVAPPSVDLIVSESGKWAVFQSLKAGSFQVFVYTALGDVPSDPAIITITVLDDPTPTPPLPPAPPTPPDVPADDITKDPLYLKLSPIYAADSDLNKADQKKKLIIIYQQANSLFGTYKFGTISDFIAQVHIISAQYLAPTAAKALRASIGEDLNNNLPTDPNTKLDKMTEEICIKQFNRVIKVLEAIK